MKTILIKAFDEVYKEIEDMDREEELRIRGAIAEAPLNYRVEYSQDNGSVRNKCFSNVFNYNKIVILGWKRSERRCRFGIQKNSTPNCLESCKIAYEKTHCCV